MVSLYNTTSSSVFSPTKLAVAANVPAREHRRSKYVEIFRLERHETLRIDVQFLRRLRQRQTDAFASCSQPQADAALASATRIRCHSF